MSDNEYIRNIIQDAKCNEWPVGLYGLGQLGQDMGCQFLEWIGLKPDFVCDKNKSAIEEYQKKHPDVKGVDYDSLLLSQKEALVFVCVGVAYIEEVCSVLRENPLLHIITIDDITSLDSVLEKFYGVQNIRSYAKESPSRLVDPNSVSSQFQNERIAIYTCVTGGYDHVKEPLCVEENCDYYLISDRQYPDLQVYRQLDVNDFIPNGSLTNAEKNRWCKMHGHRIFKDHRYSIYLDGSIQLTRPISQYVKQVGHSGIAIHKHPLRSCIYEEGLRLIASKRGNIDYQGLRRQMKRYLEDGMPREYGLFECTMIVRDNSNSIGKQITEEWFEEYLQGERRDQLSLTYVLWKNAIPSGDVGILNDGQNIRKNPDFTMNEEHGT